MTTIYTEEWHTWHKWTNEYSTKALFAVFAHLGVPRTFIDIGCADGHLVKIAASLCSYAIGYDIAVEEEARVNYDLFQHDLAKPLGVLKQPSPGDLLICWEVAEHLSAKSADTLCDSLADNVSEGGWLVFTAAIPGQGGHGHINEQPHAYWRQKLEARGLTYDEEKTEALRATWKAVCGPAWWYPQNVQIFRR